MKLNRMLIMAGIAVAMTLSASKLLAQNDPPRDDRRGRGGFDMAEFQKRMAERIREQMDVKDDAEWKLIQERIEKVAEARRQVGIGGFMGAGFGRGGGPRPGGDSNASQSDRDRGRGGFGERSPEAEALQKAIDSKAPKAELKAALDKFRAARKEKQAALEKAQAELQKVLSLQQEAVAVQMGLLN